MRSNHTQSGDALLSISIDIAGSTAAKQRIQEFQSLHGTHEQQFKAYLKAVCRIESEFYTALNRARVARLGDLFVVKHIGDEIWCVIPIVKEQTTRSQALIHDVLGALSSMLQRTGAMGFVIADRPEEPYDEPDEELEIDSIELGVKVTVDLLTSVTEFTEFRSEYLGPQYMQRTIDPDVVKSTAHVLQQLNFGTTEVEATKIRIATRADYVGLDVDRFFRLTGKALPGLITVGNTLCHYLCVEEYSDGAKQYVRYWTSSEDRAFYDFHPNAVLAGTHAQSWGSITQPPAELKGITEPYGFRYLFHNFVPSLPGIARVAGYGGIYADTIKLLRENSAVGGPIDAPSDA